MRWIFGLILPLLILLSCSEEKRKAFLKKKDKHNAFVFNVQHYFSKNELNMSFPIWFNDSIVKLNGIQKMTRSIFMSGKDLNQGIVAPKEVKTYNFNKDGEVLSVQIEQFYENVKVADVIFDYLSGKDDNGFAIVERRRIKSVGEDDNENPYRIYEKEEYKEKFLVYTNEQSGDYLFYLLNRKNWGTISVDSILSPTPDDIVSLGSPYFPVKVYQVENTVNEFNVVKYTYDKSERYIKEIFYVDYPFSRKRSILYADNGECQGFVDSTFTDNKFLKRRDSKFSFKEGLPEILKHENYSTDSSRRFFQYEKFEYTFFD